MPSLENTYVIYLTVKKERAHSCLLIMYAHFVYQLSCSKILNSALKLSSRIAAWKEPACYFWKIQRISTILVMKNSALTKHCFSINTFIITKGKWGPQPRKEKLSIGLTLFII